MSDQPLQLRVGDGTHASASHERAPSIVQRIAGSQMTNQPLPAHGTRVWLAVIVIILGVGAATAWTVLARNHLDTSIVDETAQHVLSARRAFDGLRAQTQANLTAHCRVLVEDPRLKATLATEGMDAATVADILQDLGKLRRGGFLLVLAPDGRVFAQAGASELEGLDLSASAVVKKARDADDAAVGSWAIAGKVLDLSIKSVRYGETLVAYLVVGQAVDESLLAAIGEQTGVSLASVLANKVVVASSKDPLITDVFSTVVAEAGGSPAHIVTSNGYRYIASSVELTETAQSHRLVLVTSLETVAQRFRVLGWMLYAPPVLLLIAALVLAAALRSPRRIT